MFYLTVSFLSTELKTYNFIVASVTFACKLRLWKSVS